MYSLLYNKHIKILLLALFISTFSIAQKSAIIEFGWDYPTVDFLSKKLDSIQSSPFDGICFSLQQKFTDLMDTNLYEKKYFEYEKLKSLNWGKYKNNYIILRAQGKSGPQWFDDTAWVNRLKNMKGLSMALLTGKIKGVLLDAEYYREIPLDNPWTYSEKQYPDKTFEEVRDQVRKRGTQFIKALQNHTNNFSILSIWISSLIMDDEKVMPYAKARHALLPCFIEGVLLGKVQTVQVIDGNELAYWNTKPSEFIESPVAIQNTTVRLMKTEEGKKLAKAIKISQPVFYDGLLVRHPSFNLGSDTNARWNWLEENLKNAIATSTSNMVWFYNERVDWWRGNVNDTLVNILQNCKVGFPANNKAAQSKTTLPQNFNVNSSQGYYYSTNKKTPMKSKGVAFSYTLNKKNKTLKLNYTDRKPLRISIYNNGKMIISSTPSDTSDKLVIKAIKKGVIAILAKYSDETEASAFINY
jgi:hypothetical protein